jgi:NADPH:quinone reductase-like Zn-dependent oxidoreductase
MKAIVHHKYGPPEVLELKEVQKPIPRDDEVLIKVFAASVNPYDWHQVRGKPILFRLSTGLFVPKHITPGKDVAGKIEAVGKSVKHFTPGDEVFGTANYGALAEYASVAERNLELIPSGSTFAQAATLPMAGITALQSLRDNGKIRPGQKVLINGSSGGVGTFAVQLAKWFGAEVTGVCSSQNTALVRSLGADYVIDYTKKDFTQSGRYYDLIIDNVGNKDISEIKRVLNPGGICVVVGFTSVANLLKVFLHSPFRKKTNFMIPKFYKKDLTFLKELVESNKILPVIDKSYPLDEVTEAIRYLEKGHARGKVVITVP